MRGSWPSERSTLHGPQSHMPSRVAGRNDHSQWTYLRARTKSESGPVSCSLGLFWYPDAVLGVRTTKEEHTALLRCGRDNQFGAFRWTCVRIGKFPGNFRIGCTEWEKNNKT